MFKLIDSLNHFILIFSMFSQCLLMTPAVPAGADILKKVSLCVRPQPLAAKRAKGNPFLMKTGVFLLLTLALAAIQCAAQSTIVPYTFTTIAGELEGGYTNGPNGQARFNSPEGVAVDSTGNLYVADKNNNVIRKMTQVGTDWVVMPLAGQPGTGAWADAPTGSGARFNGPRGVAVDPQGNVYVADSGNNAIRLIKPSGAVSTLAGNPLLTEYGAQIGGYQEGVGTNALFNLPTSVAVDSSGNLYVADYNNNVIRKLTKSGSLDIWGSSLLAGLPTSAGIGSADGVGTKAQFNYPRAVAVDAAGNVYVADTENNEIRKVTPAGVVSTLAGSPPTSEQINNYFSGIGFPNQDGTGKDAGFFFPYGLAVDSAANVYVADSYNCEIRKVTPQGMVTTLGGQPAFDPLIPTITYPTNAFKNGAGSDARFFMPIGVAVDSEGNLYVGDCNNNVIRKGVAPVIQVVALEVTQVIQDWSNSIPLVQDKETYVRAHLQLSPGNHDPVTVSGALLYGYGPGGPLPKSPVHPINDGGSLSVGWADASKSSNRETFAKSLNFRLPPEWLSGSIFVQLVWPGGLEPVNVVSNNCAVPVTFVPAAVPQILFIPLSWTDNNSVQHVCDQNLFTDLPNRVLSCFPVASVPPLFGPAGQISSYLYKGLRSAGQPAGQPPPVAVEDYLKWLRSTDTSGQLIAALGGKWNLIYHGVLPVSKGSLQPRTGNTPDIPGVRSWSLLYGSSAYGTGRQTVSHEIGHNLGLWHDVDAKLFYTDSSGSALGAAKPYPETGPFGYAYPLFQPFNGYPKGAPTLGPMTKGDNSLIYGLDTFTLRTARKMEPVVAGTDDGDPNCYFDLMSYCRNAGPDDEDAWPSSVTYASLLSSNNTYFGSAPLRLPHAQLHRRIAPPPHGQNPVPMDLQEDYLLVGATVDFDAGTAQFRPCLPLTTTNAPPGEPPGTNFLLEALNGSGTTLQSIEFALAPNPFGEEGTNQSASFIVALASDAAIRTLMLWHNGSLMATLIASPHAPTLTLLTPNGGQDFGTGTVSVAWSGTDADGDTLAYTVQCSADNGASWKTLAVDVPDESLEFDSSQLPATTKGLIRVIASDGLNTATAQSAANFTVRPHAPVVSINSPADGSIFIGQQQLFLDASANDLQDGALGGTSVQWHSDLDGALGTGPIVTFDPTVLSEGYHTITAMAVDSAGLTNSVVTHFLELHYPPPQLNLQVTPGTMMLGRWYPPYGTLSWPSYYTNYVLQASASLTSGWAAMTNPSPWLVGNLHTLNVGVTNKASFFRLMMQP